MASQRRGQTGRGRAAAAAAAAHGADVQRVVVPRVQRGHIGLSGSVRAVPRVRHAAGQSAPVRPAFGARGPPVRPSSVGRQHRGDGRAGVRPAVRPVAAAPLKPSHTPSCPPHRYSRVPSIPPPSPGCRPALPLAVVPLRAAARLRSSLLLPYCLCAPLAYEHGHLRPMCTASSATYVQSSLSCHAAVHDPAQPRPTPCSHVVGIKGLFTVLLLRFC